MVTGITGDIEAADPTIRRDLRSVVTRLVGLGMGCSVMTPAVAQSAAAPQKSAAAPRNVSVSRGSGNLASICTTLVAVMAVHAASAKRPSLACACANACATSTICRAL